LSADIGRALNVPELRDGLNKLGLVPAYLDAGEFDALIRSEMQRYGRIVNSLKLRLD
jgi:tripartite-type tricarboxylate transporter receptor subunit TctC